MTISDSERRFIMTDGASETPKEWADRWRAAKMRTRCPNSWLGSHKFEPRYDMGPADLSFFTHAREFKMSNLTVEKMRTKTYIRDVCVKCGKTIERA